MVAPTEAGREYYERLSQVLVELDEAEQAVGAASVVPQGRLRISSLSAFGLRHVMSATADYATLHPQVTVLVTRYAGQDVSVLGEVARPGVYSYTTHHRLLDLIAAASGLSGCGGSVSAPASATSASARASTRSATGRVAITRATGRESMRRAT